MAFESHDERDLSMDIRAMLAAIWARKVRIVLVTVLFLAATYAILLFVPKMYESEAGILVAPRDNVYTRATGDTGPSATESTADSAISSQIELIKSRDTLQSVIESEGLRDIKEFTDPGTSIVGMISSLLGRKPAARDIDETILANLSERLSVKRARDSLVIGVGVRSEDPSLAARLANAIANAHVQRRAALSLSDTAEASVWLERQIETLRTKVADAEAKVAAFKVDNDLLTSGSSNSSVVDQQISSVASQISAAQERMNTALSRATLIDGLLKDGQPVEGVADIRDSATIQQLTQQKAQLQGEKAQKLATLLPNHPDVQAIVAQIAEIDKQIGIEGQRAAAALKSEAKIESGLIASLQSELDRLKSSAGTATRQTVTLDGLQREAKAQRDLLENYLIRYRDAASRTDINASLPDVRVVTLAAASVSPASPKTTFILAAVGIVSVVLQVGMILFSELMSGRALVVRRPEKLEPAQEPQQPLASIEPDVVAVPQTVTEDQFIVSPAADIAEIDEVAEMPPEPAPAEDAANDDEEEAVEPMVQVQVQEPARPSLSELTKLSADIGLGRARVVVLAAVGSQAECAAVAESLTGDALRRGLSVARVDAASGVSSDEPGLTDLAADLASFGDVVQKSVREGLSEVPWGQLPSINRRSMKPVTLVEALTDIYEVVLVSTGRVGVASSLPVFAGLDCRLVLVTNQDIDAETLEAAELDAESLGYHPVQVVPVPARRAA